MKEIDDYLKMEAETLYESLLMKVIEEPEKGNELLNCLAVTRRYEGDYEFRLIVDAAQTVYHSISGNYDALMPLSKGVIDRAESYQMWRQLSLGYNSLGNAYFGLGIFERALECYLMSIGNEKRHGLNEMRSVGYNNIGLIYANFNSDEKAYAYMKLALNALEKSGKGRLRYQEKKIQYMSNIVMCLCKSGKLDKVKTYLDQMKEIKEKEEYPIAPYSYLLAEMYYAFYTRDFEKGKQEYYKAKNNIKAEGSIKKLILVIGYANLCEYAGISPDQYMEELIELENDEEIMGSIYSNLFFDKLRVYYKMTGNREKYDLITDRYISSVRLGIRAKEEQQLISLEIVEDLTKKTMEAEDRCVRNTELKRIAEEAVTNRVALEKAYKKIGIINELGRRITATTELPLVIDLIYNSLKENIPMDVFIIMVPNEEKNGLRSIVNYTFGKKEEETVIPIDMPGSIFVDSYRTGKRILSWKEEEKEKFKGQHEEEDRPSAIFFPLIVDKKTIGVCSVQYGGANAYSDYHLKFLEDASPYLSIALNNALGSMELEKEINARLETQKKLEELNVSLQKMSTIDGLTEINRRRVFDEKILESLTDASYTKKAVSILMIDIDNFKAYNDTYGHLEGDGVLKKVAHVFRDVMEAYGGLSARFGGEEFIGAFSGFSAEESYYLADKIRQEIEDLKILHSGSKTGYLTVSIGVAICYVVDVSMKSELMRVADESLYKAKNNGKNQVVITEI